MPVQHATPADSGAARTLYTLGHSNHAPEVFLAYLETHGIGRLVDVRTRPYSRWPWFGRERLMAMLAEAGIDYRWMGDTLGGRPPERALYDADGNPDYAAMARHPRVLGGVRNLLRLLQDGRALAILCSEGDPRNCHREHLIAPLMRDRGVNVRHIGRDGTVASVVQDAGAERGNQMSLDL